MAASRLTPSRLEQRLIEAVEQGVELDLAGAAPVDEAAMRSWRTDRTIRAEIIRDIVRGRLAADPDPRGLRLRGVRVAGLIDLENITGEMDVRLIDCALPGGLLLRDAKLLNLDLTGSRIGQQPGPASHTIDALRFTARKLDLTRASVIGATTGGTIQLSGARLDILDCSGAHLKNTAGSALVADGLRVDLGVFMREGFTAAGTGDDGAIGLLGARLGRLECDGAKLTNDAGPALAADGAQIDHNVFLRDGFVATGASERSTIGLNGARIGGLLDCTEARLTNTRGPALSADSLQVDQSVLLTDGFRATGNDEQGTVLLNGARIGGELWLDVEGITSDVDARSVRVDLDGTTYSGLPRPLQVSGWLRVLRHHTPSYASQPYQQLAAAHRGAGNERQVREILMAQRQSQIDRRAVTGWDRIWTRLTGVTLGFGYQPWRALIVLLGVLVLSIGLAVGAGHHGALHHTSRAATPKAACGVLEYVGVGLDLGIPLVKTATRDICAPTPTALGQALTVAGWLLQALAWAFAALFIAGFTGAVRKT